MTESSLQAIIFMDKLNHKPTEELALELHAWLEADPDHDRVFEEVVTTFARAASCTLSTLTMEERIAGARVYFEARGESVP